MRPDQLVRALYERYQARDWEAAAALVHPEARLHLPATDERLVGGDRIIAFQRDYPEPWGELRVLRTVSGPDADSDTAAAEVEIVAEAGVFRCAAFWTLRDDLLLDGVEYWVTVGGEEPPPERTAAGSEKQSPS